MMESGASMPATPIILRPYQGRATADLIAFLSAGNSSALLFSPTASGKTTIACDFINRATAHGDRCLFTGDSQEIVDQTCDSLDKWGIRYGVIMGDDPRQDPDALVQVATIQTLIRRPLPAVDDLFIDECHLACADTWSAVIDAYRRAGAWIIGLSATPARLDGKGLGRHFDGIIYCPSIRELTEQGWLAPIRCYCPAVTPEPKAAGADYDTADAERIMMRRELVGNVVEHYGRLARGRSGIVAATTRRHAEALRDRFRAAGVLAMEAGDHTPRKERRRIMEHLRDGALTILCQVDICTKGFDAPRVSYLADCRMTMSFARWLQFVGRGMRIFDGKEDCLLLDHAGNVLRFGLPDEEREFSLADGYMVKRGGTADPALSVRNCKRCFYLFRSALPKCPCCGAPNVPTQREIRERDARLEEVKREKKEAAVERWKEKADPVEVFRKYMAEGQEKNYKSGWAMMKFRGVFGEWPSGDVIRAACKKSGGEAA